VAAKFSALYPGVLFSASTVRDVYTQGVFINSKKNSWWLCLVMVPKKLKPSAVAENTHPGHTWGILFEGTLL
ncbi:MAG TPA: hypothetical protein VEV15_10640, partial [Flavisolibacter sp.]|nr:hypothetical protein [Flavisolibacter sp.]